MISKVVDSHGPVRFRRLVREAIYAWNPTRPPSTTLPPAKPRAHEGHECPAEWQASILPGLRLRVRRGHAPLRWHKWWP